MYGRRLLEQLFQIKVYLIEPCKRASPCGEHGSSTSTDWLTLSSNLILKASACNRVSLHSLPVYPIGKAQYRRHQYVIMQRFADLYIGQLSVCFDAIDRQWISHRVHLLQTFSSVYSETVTSSLPSIKSSKHRTRSRAPLSSSLPGSASEGHDEVTMRPCSSQNPSTVSAP